nr:hypothetical protein [Armatimonas sp.]
MQASPLPPAEFVAKARAQGFVFTVKPGDQLAVKSPAPGAMTDSIRRYVSAMKPELLALLLPEYLTSKVQAQNSAKTTPHETFVSRALALALADGLPEDCGGDLVPAGRVNATVLYWHDLTRRLQAQPFPDCQSAAALRYEKLVELCRVALEALDSSP